MSGTHMGTTPSASAKTAHLLRVIELLDLHAQRATYGAVGGVVGLPAQSVMQGQPKTHRNSWVVSATRLTPTGYDEAERDPRLFSRSAVLCTREALSAWLRTHW